MQNGDQTSGKKRNWFYFTEFYTCRLENKANYYVGGF